MPALSQVPEHLTYATIFTLSPAATPMTFPIFSATAAPPTGHAFTGASPAAIAFAKASHPAYPQPPQLFPGRNSLTSISFSSTGTANAFAANPKRSPIRRPIKPTTTAAIITPVIYTPPFYTRPAKPQNAIAIKLAVTSTIGVPLKECGISLNSILSRILANITIDTRKPSAVKRPVTTLSTKLQPFVMLLSATPKTAQFVVIRGR